MQNDLASLDIVCVDDGNDAELLRFAVPAGDQQVRWLGLSAAERVREASGIVGLPSRIDVQGRLLSPATTLKEVASVAAQKGRSSEVRVMLHVRGGLPALAARASAVHSPTLAMRHLVHADERDTDTHVVRTLWQASAFNHRSDTAAAAAAASALHNKQVDEEKARVSAVQIAEWERGLSGELKSLAAALRGGPSAKDRTVSLATALENEWPFVRVQAVTKVEKDIAVIKQSVLKCFEELNTIYAAFSAYDEGRGIATMQLHEWVHLFHVLQLHSADQRMLAACFRKANADRAVDTAAGGNDSDVTSLSRFEFIEAVIYAADALYSREGERPGMRFTPQPAKAVEKLLTESFVPLARRLGTGHIRTAMQQRSFLLWLAPRSAAIMAVYSHYAAMDPQPDEPKAADKGKGGGAAASAAAASKAPTAAAAAAAAAALSSPSKSMLAKSRADDPAAVIPGPRRGLMSLREFALCMEHAGLTPRGVAADTALDVGSMAPAHAIFGALGGRDVKPGDVGSKEIRQAFFESQHEWEGGAASDKMLYDEMVPGEFLEAVARLALAKWGSMAGLRIARTDASRGDAALLRVSHMKIQNREATASGDAEAMDAARAALAALTSSVPQVASVEAEAEVLERLLMWAFEAVEALAGHLGKPAGVEVLRDPAEVVRAANTRAQTLLSTGGAEEAQALFGRQAAPSSPRKPAAAAQSPSKAAGAAGAAAAATATARGTAAPAPAAEPPTSPRAGATAAEGSAQSPFAPRPKPKGTAAAAATAAAVAVAAASPGHHAPAAHAPAVAAVPHVPEPHVIGFVMPQHVGAEDGYLQALPAASHKKAKDAFRFKVSASSPVAERVRAVPAQPLTLSSISVESGPIQQAVVAEE